MPIKESLKNFGKTIHRLSRSDRDVTVGCGGFSGEGKSVFMIQLQKHYANNSKIKWSMTENMTWSREEFFKWIDGDKKGKGRKPEYSGIIADEWVSMFFNRNWYQEKQIEAIEKLNKCRDRHLFICGALPVFWQLDSGLLSRIRFYIYIPRGRGRAWVFEQEDNPFSKDPWNINENSKVFRKKKSPYTCPNFVCEVDYPDLNEKEKAEYYEMRNTKRVDTELQNKQERSKSYAKIKKQRDSIIYELKRRVPKIKHREIAHLTGLDPATVGKILESSV